MKHKWKCNKCYKSFIKEYNFTAHLDEHTPYWKGKKVTLSGADQIRLMLKTWVGGWNKFIKDEKKRVKQKGTFDLEKAIRLRDFEIDNNIRFIINGDKVESFLDLSVNQMENQS